MEGEPEAVFWSSVLIASAHYRNKPQSSYSWQQCWTDLILFCGVFKVWFDLIFNGATISRTPHSSVQGCNAAVSTVSHDLKHISLHLILQNQSFFFCLQIPAPKTREIVWELVFARASKDQKEFGRRRSKIHISLSKMLKIWKHKNGKGRPAHPFLFSAGNLGSSWQYSKSNIFMKQTEF